REPGWPDRRQPARRDDVHSESEYPGRAGTCRRLQHAARRRQEGLHSLHRGLHLLQEELNHHLAPTPTRFPKKAGRKSSISGPFVIPRGVPSALRARAARGGTRERYWTISV